jgi:hypothetical protein
LRPVDSSILLSVSEPVPKLDIFGVENRAMDGDSSSSPVEKKGISLYNPLSSTAVEKSGKPRFQTSPKIRATDTDRTMLPFNGGSFLAQSAVSFEPWRCHPPWDE